MNSRRILTAVVLGAVLIVGLVTAATPPEGGGKKPGVARIAPVMFGEPFPAYTYTNLNTKAGGAAQIDLAGILGKKPVVFYYFIPKNQRAEKVFVDLQALVAGLGPDKVSLIGVAVPRSGLGEDVIQARAASLQIRVPILRDDQFRIGQLLNVRRVPHIALLDQAGNLRLTNGGSLLQALEYKMTLGDGIRRLAESGKLGSYGALKYYSPSV
jgi:hypothetical protein